jgi:hypothetical protein
MTLGSTQELGMVTPVVLAAQEDEVGGSFEPKQHSEALTQI